MAYFKRDRFSGIAPGVAPRLLAEQFGQTAENIDFESGRISPIKEDTDSFTLQNAQRRSIFFYRDTNWLEWNEDNVSVVVGPIPGDNLDRLYFTGDDYPRMGTATTIVSGTAGYPGVTYKLGVPAPTGAPTTTKNGTADETQDPYDVSYVYTLVTEYGEEGPPSPASTPIELTDAETVTVSIPTPSLASGTYNFGSNAKKRIYRSNTGSLNTQFQFVKEVAFTETSATDDKDGDELGEILPSTFWIGPPDDDTSLYPDGPLQGLIAVGNGIMAGFTGKRFCLSEAYLPHAWPVGYRITTEEDIVAIAATGNGVVALTDGQPYFITGTDPSAMTAIRLDIAQACININSVVDMGEYVLYAGPDGLVAVSGSQAEVVTRGLVSPAQWNSDFYPDLIRSFVYEGTYVAFYTSGSTHGGWVFDPRASEAALSTLTISSEVRGGYTNPKTGELYIIVGNKIKKYRAGSTLRTAKWKSKKYVTPAPTSMGWVSVKADSYPVTVKVWGDGTLIANYTISYSNNVYTQATLTPSNISNATLQEPVMRLPATRAQEWEVEVSGAVDINEVCLAQSMDEIRGV